MAVGFGFRRMAGRGWARNPGAGRHITTAAGSTTTTPGRGARVVIITAVAVGGGRRWSRFTFRLAITSAGIHSITTKEIRVRDIIAIMIVIDFARYVAMSWRDYKELIRRIIAR